MEELKQEEIEELDNEYWDEFFEEMYIRQAESEGYY